MSDTWRYRATAANGRVAKGQVQAETAERARAVLRERGLVPVHLAKRSRHGQRLRELKSPFDIHALARPRRRRSLMDQLDGLSTLLRTGTPLASALSIQAHSAPTKGLRTLADRLSENVRNGQSLSQSIEDERSWYDEIDAALIRSAEKSGALEDGLEAVVRRHQAANRTQSKLLAALAYPTSITIAGIGVWLFLSNVTLPPIVDVLVEADVEVPPLSNAVIHSGQWVTDQPVFLISGAIVTLGAVAVAPRTRWWSKNLGERIDRHRPRALRNMSLAVFAHELAVLISVGIPIVEALRTVAPATRPLRLHRAALQVANRVEEGQSLSEALSASSWFDPEFVQVVALGEQSGELPQLLKQAADRLARQSARRVELLAAISEPVAILGAAAMIGVVVMAAILPMLALQDVIR